jgi:hypothetical protein
MGGISLQVHLTASVWIAITVVKPADKEEQAKTLMLVFARGCVNSTNHICS